jgi:hypothetical protein
VYAKVSESVKILYDRNKNTKTYQLTIDQGAKVMDKLNAYTSEDIEIPTPLTKKNKSIVKTEVDDQDK